MVAQFYLAAKNMLLKLFHMFNDSKIPHTNNVSLSALIELFSNHNVHFQAKNQPCLLQYLLSSQFYFNLRNIND